jgi:hypothetical protein
MTTDSNATVSAKTFNIVSQLGHFAAGLAVVFGCHDLWGFRGVLIGLPIFIVIVVLKEFVYDYFYENVVERGSSLLDFGIYMLGAWTALVMILARYGHL